MEWKTPFERKTRRFSVGRPTADQAAIRTEHVIHAAFETFLEFGYEGASVAEIARRVGSSKQTIYSRFPTKADLFKAVIRQGTDSLHELFNRILVPDLAVEKVLQKYGENLGQILRQDDAREFFRMVIAASRDFPEMAEFFWEQGSQQAKKRLAEYLRSQSSKGVLRVTDPMLAAEMFDSLCVGPAPMMAIMGIPLHHDESQIRRHVRESVRVFLAAYGPETGSKKTRSRT